MTHWKHMLFAAIVALLTPIPAAAHPVVCGVGTGSDCPPGGTPPEDPPTEFVEDGIGGDGFEVEVEPDTKPDPGPGGPTMGEGAPAD